MEGGEEGYGGGKRNAESRSVRKTITKSIAMAKSKAKSAMQIVEIMGLQMYEERDGDGDGARTQEERFKGAGWVRRRTPLRLKVLGVRVYGYMGVRL